MTAQKDVQHWRAQVFARLLLIILGLGSITAIPSIALAISERQWITVTIDTLALAWLALLWRLKGLSHQARVVHFLSVVFLLGVALLIRVGPVSQIYLMGVPIFAALLLGTRPALWALGLTALTLLLVGIATGAELRYDGAPENAYVRSGVITLNFLFLSSVLTLSCTALVERLAKSHDDLRVTADSLESGQRILSALNAELRLTSAAVARLNEMVVIAEVVHDSAAGGAAEQRIIFVNDAFEQRTGYWRDEVLGQDMRMLRGAATDPRTLERIARAMERNDPVSAELLNYTKAGEPYWIETELVPFANEVGMNTHWVAVERDITGRKKSEDDIHRLAFFDVLTGLPNRRLLMDRIDKLLASSARGGTFSAVMFIDLDHFKYINDARGHAIGDTLLRTTAERLSRLMRKADTVARIGGDEFVVLLAHLASDLHGASHAALVVAEKVRAAIAQDVAIQGHAYSTSASIGVTVLPNSGQSADDLLREADTAMYRAKAAGRNGIAFFEAAMQEDVERRFSMERELAEALDSGLLAMHLQPQVDRDGRPVGAELLMRWRRPDGSMVPPAVFIPIAEESGLMVRLGEWALQQACLAQLQLADAGHAIALSVNVSPIQFRQANFVERVRAIIDASGAQAALLILEVTEGLLVENLDDTIARMHELAAMGIRFSIDDFGTGYSSLAYLKTMPLYALKIDRSFIQDTPTDASDTAIVQAILAMARHLRLAVVAEGVETWAQADFLIANACDAMQGYLFARPLAMPALLNYLAQTPPAKPPAPASMEVIASER